jgi:hypothetical protein
MTESFQTITERAQLSRLATLNDVVYALALVLVVQWLPMPAESQGDGEVWLLGLFAEHTQNLIAILIGLVFIITYWRRSNLLLSALDRTDSIHTSLSMASLFFLLMLLYVVRVGPEIAAGSGRMGQSVTVALIGIAAGGAWWRARRAGLVREGVEARHEANVQVEAFTEPITALVTVPFAFASPLLWNLAWLSYVPISALLRHHDSRRQQARNGHGTKVQ